MKQDSYMDQAAKFAETTKDEITKQATQLYDTVQKTVTNEENQQQAADTTGGPINTIGEQARGMYDAAEKTVTDEENQQMVKDKWNEMADSLKAMVGVQQEEEKSTFQTMSDNVQNFLTDAKTSLEETDFQDIKNEADSLLDQVKKSIFGDKEN